MRGGWRRKLSGESHAVPVEMRFVDMFMAALGALIFMAMLFAFLLKGIRPDASPIPAATDTSPLRLTTKGLPAARQNEPYEVAFAYRGGRGAVIFEIAAGEIGEIPGMQFDASEGMLRGTPNAQGTLRFVLRIRDSANETTERPYELLIVPSRKGTRTAERWLNGLMIAGALIVLLMLLGIYATLGHVMQGIEAAWDRGEFSFTYQNSDNETTTVDLPGGIEEHRLRMRGFCVLIWSFSLALTILIIWFVLRIWVF